MRSLFLKIFLWYWLTFVLVGLAVAITWSLQPETIVSRWRASTGEAVRMYAQSSAEEFDHFGPKPLANYFERLHANGNIDAALLDQSGNILAGQVPETARAFALKAPPSDQPQFVLRTTSADAVQRVTGPTGQTYIFIASMPRSPLNLLRSITPDLSLRWVVSFLVSALICYLLTAYLTRPMLMLSATARQIAAGDLSARANPAMERRNDEMGTLVKDFNQMASRLDELIKSHRQLISDISHELRSPLARLGVALGLARQRAGDGVTVQLDRIELESERLNEMIGRLLTLARLQAADPPPLTNTLSLRELLDEVASDAAFEALEKHCAVNVTAAEDCTVKGNPDLLRSAIENVVRNAIHYSPDNSSIDISMLCEDGKAHVRVRDHGPGLPESELTNIFRPFYRVENARDRQSGGTGLGLAITLRAVSLHSGNVEARNAPGGGLIIEITLPATTQPVLEPTQV